MKHSYLFALLVLTFSACEKSEPVAPPTTTPDVVKEPTPGDFKKWPEACKTMKAVFGDDLNREVVDQTYHRGHLEIRPVTAWEFSWNGVSIPVPQTDYEAVLFDHGTEEGQLEVTLEGVEAVVELTFVLPSEIEHKTLHPGGFYENPDTRVAWDKAFDRYDTVRGLDLAYRSSFDDIKCEVESAANDLLIARGFHLVGGDTSEARARVDWKVFEFTHPGFPTGFRRYTHSGKVAFNWEVVMLPEAVDATPLRVRYGVAPDGPFGQIGHYVGVDYDRAEAERPVWLDAMQTTFNTFTPATMAALEEAFDGTGIKTRGTIGELRAIANGERQWSELSARKTKAK